MLLNVKVHLAEEVLCLLRRCSRGAGDQHISEQLAEIKELLMASATREEEIMASNQEILDEVTAQGTVADSVLVIVQALASENDPVKRQAIFDGLKANRVKLEAAIVAGTPIVTPPVDPPVSVAGLNFKNR